jgi:hypothetical protein
MVIFMCEITNPGHTVAVPIPTFDRFFGMFIVSLTHQEGRRRIICSEKTVWSSFRYLNSEHHALCTVHIHGVCFKS